MRLLGVLATAAGFAASQATFGGQLFKCVADDGKVTFSQTQCAPTAQAVDVNVYRPSKAQVEQHLQRVQENQQLIDQSIARQRAVNAEAERQRAIQAIEARHAREQADIAARRSLTNNNAAGAILENALATDAAASDARYRADMDRLLGK